MTWPVWLFVPNLIGYVRIISGLMAFIAARDPARWAEFFCLYGFSYSLDAVDGVAARKLGQTSRLGAVLDMITDRFCTAGLLSVLAALYPSWHWVFTFLMILDIISHWAQMYSSLAGGFGSHKAVADETALLRFYYTYPYALFWICTFNETFLAMMFLLAHEKAVTGATPWLMLGPNALLAEPLHLVRVVCFGCFPVFALKQVISVVQLATAFWRITDLDVREGAGTGKKRS